MIGVFFHTLTICFLMEIGSASNFTIAAMANSSPKWIIVLIAGVSGIFIADLLAVKLGCYISKLPISSNLISGMVMIVMGLFFLFQKGD